AQHMAGGMKTQGHAVMVDARAVGQRLQIDVLPQPRPQNAFAGRGRQVMPTAPAGMVAMTMGDHRPLHTAPRVDVKIAGRTVEPFGAGNDQLHADSWARGFCWLRVGWSGGGSFEGG